MAKNFKLKNGAQLLSTEAPGGIYNASQLKKLAELCENTSAFVKATEDQRLSLILTDDQVGPAQDELRPLGITIRPYQDGLHQPVSCIGDLCPDAEQDALSSAIDISQELAGIQSSTSLRIGINGCARCCVPCHTLDIAVMGEVDGYRLTIGGKNSHMPELGVFAAEGIPAAELPKVLRKLIEAYGANSNEGETLQEAIERNGTSAFLTALMPYSQDAGGSDVSLGSEDEPAAEAAAEEAPAATENNVTEDGVNLDTIGEPEMMGDEGLTTDTSAAETTPSESAATPRAHAASPSASLDEKLAATAQAVETMLANDDGSDDVSPGASAQPTMIEADALDIDPSSSSIGAVDINPNAGSGASELSSDVMIGDDDLSVEEAGAENVSEEQESALEEKLEASIAEEQSIESGSDEEDSDAAERMRTLTLVQGSLEAKAPSTDEPIESIQLADEDHQLEIDATELEPELMEVEEAGPESGVGDSSGSDWSLSALMPVGESSIEFQYDGGAKVTFDLTRMPMPPEGRTFKIGTQEFRITPNGNGYQVETDGMAVTLPGRAA